MSTYAEKYAIVLPLVIQGAEHWQIVQALAVAGHLPSRGLTVYALIIKAERYLQRARPYAVSRYCEVTQDGQKDPLLK